LISNVAKAVDVMALTIHVLAFTVVDVTPSCSLIHTCLIPPVLLSQDFVIFISVSQLTVIVLSKGSSSLP
jgi:hypothetical protein